MTNLSTNKTIIVLVFEGIVHPNGRPIFYSLLHITPSGVSQRGRIPPSANTVKTFDSCVLKLNMTIKHASIRKTQQLIWSPNSNADTMHFHDTQWKMSQKWDQRKTCNRNFSHENLWVVWIHHMSATQIIYVWHVLFLSLQLESFFPL